MGITQDPVNSNDDPPPVGGSGSGGRSGGRNSDEPNALGVPNDYTAPRREGRREELGDIRFRRDTSYIRQVPPSYFDGDEYIPANWPATSIWQLQQALARVGLLTGTFTKSTWDSTTRNAYKELLGLANAQGLDADRALSELLSSSGDPQDASGGKFTVDDMGNIVPVGGKAVRAPLVTRTTDPAALRSTFRKAVIEMLGEGWSTEDIDKMVAAYNNVEVARQTQMYNMEETGGNVMDIPSPEAFIESQVLAKDPVGVQTNEALGFTNEFMQLANSPAWGVS